uniref:arylamine N-acetyltransferase n=1 Tax=Oncorhynchus mykiss TaxID=8022 RepID=A0A8K9UYB3_ONCMY
MQSCSGLSSGIPIWHCVDIFFFSTYCAPVEVFHSCFHFVHSGLHHLQSISYNQVDCVGKTWMMVCYENTLLFAWVLKEMCYNPVTLGSRVYNNTINQFGPKDSHLINKVVIDGTAYIADVSFGVSSQIWHPLELVSGKDQPQSPDVFRLIQDGDLWKLEKTGRKPLVLNEAFANSPLVHKTNKLVPINNKAGYTI